MREELRLLALLSQHPLEFPPKLFRQDHVFQTCVRVAHGEEASQLATRESEGYRPRWSLGRRAIRPCLVEEIAQLPSELAVTETGLVGRELHGDRVEVLVVPAAVALE
jgi:hypothetical protein